MTISEALRTTITSARRAWNFEELTREHSEVAEADMRNALQALVDQGLIVRTDVPTSRGAVIPYWRGATPSNTQGSAFDPTARPRRMKFSPEVVERFTAALPATTATLMQLLGVSQVQVISIARRAQAVHVKRVWHRTKDYVFEDRARDLTDNGVGSSAPTSPIAYAPPTETFQCARRGKTLLVAQCYEDFLNAACRLKSAPAECHRCPQGQKLRDDYARGA